MCVKKKQKKHSAGEMLTMESAAGAPDRAHSHTQASLYPINIRLVAEPIDSFFEIILQVVCLVMEQGELSLGYHLPPPPRHLEKKQGVMGVNLGTPYVYNCK